MRIQKVKVFNGNTTSMSSSDERTKNYLQKLFGKAGCGGGGSFHLTLDTAKALVKLMEKENVKSVWGSSMCQEFGNVNVDFKEIIVNKKLAVIISDASPVFEEDD